MLHRASVAMGRKSELVRSQKRRRIASKKVSTAFVDLFGNLHALLGTALVLESRARVGHVVLAVFFGIPDSIHTENSSTLQSRSRSSMRSGSRKTDSVMATPVFSTTALVARPTVHGSSSLLVVEDPMAMLLSILCLCWFWTAMGKGITDSDSAGIRITATTVARLCLVLAMLPMIKCND